MDYETNTPDIGTGYSEDQATLAISSILDREQSTPDEAIVETDELPVESGDESATKAAEEQPVQDSETDQVEAEDVVADENGEGEDQGTAPKIDDSYEIEMDGNKINIGELKKGYLRQDDYSRKTQEVARVRKELNAEIATVSQRNSDQLEQIKKIAFAEIKAAADIDWDKLYNEDRYLFAEKQKEVQEHAARVGRIVADIDAHESAKREAQAKLDKEAFEQGVEESYRFMAQEYPDVFGTKETAIKAGTELFGFLTKQMGFPREEVQQIADGKLLKVAYMASQYEKLLAEKNANQQKIVKAKAALPQQTKPVAPKQTNAGRPSDLSRARDSFFSNPSDMDAAQALISQLL